MVKKVLLNDAAFSVWGGSISAMDKDRGTT